MVKINSVFAPLLSIFCLGCMSGTDLPATVDTRIINGTGEHCSIYISSLERSRPARFNTLFSAVDRVRAHNPSVVVTYLDTGDPLDAVFTGAGECPRGDNTWIHVAQKALSQAGFRLSRPFSPGNVNVGGATHRISDLFYAMHGPSREVEDCSIAIELFPSTSVEEDIRFERQLGRARDIYGIPILFSAQQGDAMYVTFYRGCSELGVSFSALKAVLDIAVADRLRSYRLVDRRELAIAYGGVL